MHVRSPFQVIFGWLLTPIFLFFFASTLVIFQPLQIAAWRFGYGAHKRVLEVMNYCILTCLRLIGTRFVVDTSSVAALQPPVILVSNHQSMYDIPLFVWYLRQLNPKFVAKTELGKGIPSISYALRTMGSVLIDRSKPRQAIPAIKRWGEMLQEKNFSGCIFPEGTRARDGMMKPFRTSGAKALLESMPNATVVPVAIVNSWELLRYKFMPVPFGVRVYFRTLRPIPPSEGKREEVFTDVEAQIREAVTQLSTR